MEHTFNFEITDRIAVLSRTGAGYTLELNKVAYNGYPAKLDLRKWKDGKPLKGVTLSDDEASELLTALKRLEG